MNIGVDWDGTLVKWFPRFPPNYSDPKYSIRACGANVPVVAWLRQQVAQGHTCCIITGRNRAHGRMIKWVLREAMGLHLDVYCRPDHVSLHLEAQAKWKASIIRELAIELYVGDNLAIDARAATLESIRFASVATIEAADS